MAKADLSRLHLLFILLACVVLFSLSYTLASVLLHPSQEIGWCVFALVRLSMLGIIVYGSIQGSRIGVLALGRTGGWIYAGLSLIQTGYNLYQNYYFSHVDNLYEQDHTLMIMGYIGAAVDMLVTIALILFVVGTRVWMPIRIGLPVMMLIVYTVSNFFNRMVYEYITVGNILAAVMWITVLILVLIRPRR